MLCSRRIAPPLTAHCASPSEIRVPQTCDQQNTISSDGLKPRDTTHLSAQAQCRICLSDITPTQLDSNTLYCDKQSQESTGPSAVAHSKCVASLYHAWRLSDTHMRLPHCPQCQTPLSEMITRRFVSTPNLIQQYQKSSRTDFTQRFNTDEHNALEYMGNTIMANIRARPSEISVLLGANTFAILARHTQMDDHAIFAALTEHCGKLDLKHRLTLLQRFFELVPFSCRAKIPLEQALVKGVLSPLTPRDARLAGRDTLLTLVTQPSVASPTQPLLTALIDLAFEQTDLLSLANLCHDLQHDADRNILMDYAAMETIALEPQHTQQELQRASTLAFDAFTRKLGALQQSPQHLQLSHIQDLYALRKHPLKAIRQLSKQTWLALSTQPPTDEICLRMLSKKLASSRGLNTQDMETLKRIIYQFNTEQAQKRLPTYTQAVLAYPRQGRGVRQKDAFMKPLSTVANSYLHRQSRQAIKNWLEVAPTVAAFSADEVEALQYLSEFAPGAVKQQAQNLLQN